MHFYASLESSSYCVLKLFSKSIPRGANVIFFLNAIHLDIVLAACSDKSLAVFDMNYGKIVRRMQDVHGRIVHTICQNQVDTVDFS